MLAEKASMKYLRLYRMGDSGQSSEDQKAGDDKVQVSAGKKDCIGLHWDSRQCVLCLGGKFVFILLVSRDFA